MHLRVKWTVDKINRDGRNFQPSHSAMPRRNERGNFRVILFVLPYAIDSLSLSLSSPFFSLFLSSPTSRPSSRIAREYFRRIFRDAVSLVPRRKSLNAIKVFLEKILREVSSRSSKVNLLSETFNMEASRLRYISLDLLRSPYRLEILTRTIHVYICIVMVSIRI